MFNTLIFKILLRFVMRIKQSRGNLYYIIIYGKMRESKNIFLKKRSLFMLEEGLIDEHKVNATNYLGETSM